MSQYFIGAETVRLAFPDGQWVDLKEEMTQADQDYVVNKMVRAKLQAKDGGASDVSLDLGKGAVMERMIVAWSFEGVPVNPDNISKLRGKYRALILEKIDELQKAAGEWSKNSVTAST
ncbi:MAG: hypothetical protein M0R74_14355 [Dehalococcoidia bacterium]|nr:hypothetical protein [Dehalococcoidia bacterium]